MAGIGQCSIATMSTTTATTTTTTITTAENDSKNATISTTTVADTQDLKDDSIKYHAKDFLTHKQQDLLCDYELGNILGEGGFGMVYSCEHRATGAERAVKVLRKDPTRPHYDENIINEYNVLKELDHPNLVKVYDLYQDDEAFFIVTDLYKGGDIFEFLEEQGPLTEEDVAIVMNNLLSTVNYCHQRNLIHRDLKPENILLDTTRDFSDIKVIDFGLARYVDHFDGTLKGLVGSSYYIAPQVIHDEYSNKCDVWSCGVIAYALLSGFAPFDASTDEEVLEVVYDGHFDFDDVEWDSVSVLAKDFITQLLQYDEVERPSAEQALQHPWLRKCRKSPRMNNALVRSASRSSIRDMSKFTSKSNKLKQAACAMIASQLLMKHEKETIDKAFRALDKSCSGQITKSDLNNSFHDFFREDDSDYDSTSDGSESSDEMNESGNKSRVKMIDDIFEEVNFSGSGAIQYSEFAVVTMLEKGFVDDDKLTTAFKFFDQRGKGYIDKNDLKDLLHLGSHAARRVLEDTCRGRKKDRITFEDFKLCILPPRRNKSSETKHSFNVDSDDDEEEEDGSIQLGGVRRDLLENAFDSPLGRKLDKGSGRRPLSVSPRRCKANQKDSGGGDIEDSSRQKLSRSEHDRISPSITRLSITVRVQDMVDRLADLQEFENDSDQ